MDDWFPELQLAPEHKADLKRMNDPATRADEKQQIFGGIMEHLQ